MFLKKNIKEKIDLYYIYLIKIGVYLFCKSINFFNKILSYCYYKLSIYNNNNKVFYEIK